MQEQVPVDEPRVRQARDQDMPGDEKNPLRFTQAD